MRFKISHKLFLAFLMILLMVICTVLVARQLFEYNLRNYIHQVEFEKMATMVPVLQRVYQENNSWAPVLEQPEVWLKKLDIGPEIRNVLPPPPPKSGEGDERMPKVVLLDADKRVLTGRIRSLDESHMLEIKVDDQVVGWLGINKPELPGERKRPVAWLERQNRQLFVVGAVVLSLTAMIALLVSKHLLKSIGALNDGAKALAERRFGTQVKVQAKDELGQLAESFNMLSRTLKRYEKMRQQWLSDISHELRTPLAILRGEIEALHDGVRKPTTENLSSLHVEVLRLSRLVEDLHQLSLDDSNYLRMEQKVLVPDKVINMAVSEYRGRFAQAQINCETHLQIPHQVRIVGDENRLIQVFRNIFENCCRYMGGPGKVLIRGMVENGELCIYVEDSGPGVPEDAMPRLFDRLFRVDNSRSRDSGGSGLGLSICRGIIEGHGGTVSAMSGSLGGLCILIRIPCRSDL